MHRNINISGHQNCALYNAEILNFRYSQNVYYQHWFFLQKPFTFTGKELDQETGYSYFGARYYDSGLSGIFLSVDPMADKYPSVSPYAYCAWNPVILVDPNGKSWETDKDIAKAAEIKQMVQNRINILEQSLDLKTKEMDNDRLSARKLDNLKYEQSELQNQISLLNDFLTGMQELEDSDIRYTFNPTKDVENKCKTSATPGSLYTINYQSGNDGNLIHETTHAIQVDRMEHGRMDHILEMEMEIGAYSTQFSFSPKSMPDSDSSVTPSSRIAKEWVKGVFYFNNGKHYPYENYR